MFTHAGSIPRVVPIGTHAARKTPESQLWTRGTELTVHYMRAKKDAETVISKVVKHETYGCAYHMRESDTAWRGR